MSNTNPTQDDDGSFPLTGDGTAQTGNQSAQTSGQSGSSTSDLQQLQQELDAMTTAAQHALADLQNYKRRAEEEKQGFVAFANAQLFRELLPSLQNMERALQHLPTASSGDSAATTATEWTTGAAQTMRQLLQSCDKLGLKPIPTVGEMFDPTRHEALLTGPGTKDMVIEELEKGYLLENRVIKPARVKVGNGEET